MVRSGENVVLLPARSLLPHILACEEDGDVQTLIAEPPIETFDEAVLDRLPRSNKVQVNAVTVGPGIHDPAGELAATLSTVIERGAPR